MSTPVVCVHCRQPCAGRFEITRFNRENVSQGTVTACSISCLLSWGYSYATIGGMRLAYGAKQTFDRIMESLKGIGK